MKTSDRLNKIASVAENVENAEKAKEIAKQNEKQALIDHIATYAERIKAIIEVGSKLVENKMPLGKQNCFQSNGWDHRFGFVVEGSLILNPDAWKIIGIGSEGGGWSGNDLTVNENGEVVSYSGRYNCESWTEEFEKLEEGFYNYVDNEI
jgi:hypothetical protein